MIGSGIKSLDTDGPINNLYRFNIFSSDWKRVLNVEGFMLISQFLIK
jgi:hypothetical protein